MAIRLEIYNRSIEKRKEGIQYWNIPSIEKAALLRFLDDLALGKVNRGKRISELRQWKYLDVLKPSLEFFRKPVSALTLKDVEKFERDLSSGTLHSNRNQPYAHATKVDIRGALQVYLRWRIGEARADKLTGWLDTRALAKTPDFLKERDIEKLFRACKSARERFLIAILFDTGARATEFHNIRYEDVDIPTGEGNHVKVTLREEYSKTKGRTISLYWKLSLETVKEYLAERMAAGIKTDEPVYPVAYAASRKFLHRLGRKVLGRPIHYHLFRHSSATFYASQMNRQQLCIRYGWTFSSDMPDIYIARAGVDMEQLDEKFTGTKVESLKHELAQEREQSKLKGARIEFLETKLEKIERYLHLVVDVLLEAPSIEQLKAELRRRRVASLAT
jgi:integrase